MDAKWKLSRIRVFKAGVKWFIPNKTLVLKENPLNKRKTTVWID